MEPIEKEGSGRSGELRSKESGKKKKITPRPRERPDPVRAGAERTEACNDQRPVIFFS